MQLVLVMIVLISLLVPLVQALTTRDSFSSSDPTTEATESSTTQPRSTRAIRQPEETQDGPVLVQLVENYATDRAEAEKGTFKFSFSETTKMAVFQPVSHLKETAPHQTLQLEDTTEENNRSQIEGETAQRGDMSLQQKRKHRVPLSTPQQKTRHEVEPFGKHRQRLFEVDEDGQAHLPVDPFSLHHPFIHSSVTEFEYSEW